MSKEVMKRVYILMGVFSLVFNVNSKLYVNQNNINEIQTPSIEIHDVVKPKTIHLTATTNAKNIQISKPKIVSIKTNKTLSRGGDIDTNYDTTFELTFYTGLVCENSKYGAVTCRGLKLFDGVAANNVLPYKTKINLKGFGTVQILDTGGKNFNSSRRLDIYIPRIKGESDDEYYHRVQRMGRVKVKGKIVS